MPVSTLHPLYSAHERRAQRSRDAVSGSDAIKGKRFNYLPHPVAEYDSLKGEEKAAADARYDAYILRASWLGVTGRTHEGMLGAVFRKPPTVTLPPALEYMLEDADGSGMSLEQFAKLDVSALLDSGRCGILSDYPEAADGLTQEQTQGINATLRFYGSQSIINWRRDGEILVLVVLKEQYETPVDEFESDRETQYRVLRLENGVYTQQVYRDEQPAGEKVTPRRGDGSTWPLIPFQFVGARNNDEKPDKPVLLDMADVNLAHYRNSADLEESAVIVGQPMIHIDIGEQTNAQDWKDLNPNGITVGSRRGVQTKGGRMEMVQAEERNLLLSLMEQKEKQMLAIGAKLLTRSGGNETAEGVRERSGVETASLSSVATNVSDALENALEWCAWFMVRGNARTAADEVTVKLNQEFYPEGADPQDVMARIAELDRGLIGKSDYRAWRRRTGGIADDRTDEEIDEEVNTGGLNLV